MRAPAHPASMRPPDRASVSGRVARRQQAQWAEQEAAATHGEAPPAPASRATDDTLEQLKQLGELKASGVLTEAEFEAQKAKILAG
jgi:Short C-terminal domain